MKFLKNHAEALSIIGSIIASIVFGMWWMHCEFTTINARFSSIDKKFSDAETAAEKRFAIVEKDLAVIKTVLIMQKVLPAELANRENHGKQVTD